MNDGGSRWEGKRVRCRQAGSTEGGFDMDAGKSARQSKCSHGPVCVCGRREVAGDAGIQNREQGGRVCGRGEGDAGEQRT